MNWGIGNQSRRWTKSKKRKQTGVFFFNGYRNCWWWQNIKLLWTGNLCWLVGEGPGSFGAYFYFHHLSCGRRIGSAQRRTAECTSGSSAPSKVGTTTVPGKSVRETVDRWGGEWSWVFSFLCWWRPPPSTPDLQGSISAIHQHNIHPHHFLHGCHLHDFHHIHQRYRKYHYHSCHHIVTYMLHFVITFISMTASLLP